MNSGKREINLIRFIVTLFFTIIFTSNVFGSESSDVRISQSNNTSIIVEGRNVRGEYIALGILEISNLGKGEIGIYSQLLTHEPVEKIKMRVYLDKLNKKTNQWETMNYYDFTYLSEDYNNSLSDPYEDFQVTGEVNNYYRLRGMYAIWNGNVSESFAADTEGLLITK